MNSFYLKTNDETVIAEVNNLSELRDELINADLSVINHHVTDERNDFATWINDSLNKGLLSFRISILSGSPEEIKRGIIKLIDDELGSKDNLVSRVSRFFSKLKLPR